MGLVLLGPWLWGLWLMGLVWLGRRLMGLLAMGSSGQRRRGPSARCEALNTGLRGPPGLRRGSEPPAALLPEPCLWPGPVPAACEGGSLQAVFAPRPGLSVSKPQKLPPGHPRIPGSAVRIRPT